MKNKILITGVAGFIGFHLAGFLLKKNYEIIGVDNLNDYYDKKLKYDRLDLLKRSNNFKFYFVDIKEGENLENIFKTHRPNYVIHLAAQAGVRYSLINPKAYLESNIIGFFNILESCKKFPVKHLIYASSSSVYGGNKKVPFSTKDNVDHPISFYAATKKSNELMAHTYSHLYQIPTTGLRFFTVYGPWGRPDMAYFIFTKNIIEGNPIKVFNYGNMERDFTYIDDVVNAIYKLLDVIPKSNYKWDEIKDGIDSSFAPYKIYNIGNNSPVKLKYFIEILENKIGKKAKQIYLEMQPGDVLKTYADITELEKTINFKPSTNIEKGLEKFVSWYLDYYNVRL
jgi:UDP-glucuronate 4-epimerase